MRTRFFTYDFIFYLVLFDLQTVCVTQKIVLVFIGSLSFFFSLVVFLDTDVISLTVKFDNKDFSLRYIDV